jgi:hypothetical protein
VALRKVCPANDIEVRQREGLVTVPLLPGVTIKRLRRRGDDLILGGDRNEDVGLPQQQLGWIGLFRAGETLKLLLCL